MPVMSNSWQGWSGGCAWSRHGLAERLSGVATASCIWAAAEFLLAAQLRTGATGVGWQQLGRRTVL